MAKIIVGGTIMHLILDTILGISHVTLFWPIFGPFIPYGDTTFLLGFTNPVTIITESLGLSFLIYIGIKNSWSGKGWRGLIYLIIFYVITFLAAYYLLVLR